jgi:hypothetical protein
MRNLICPYCGNIGEDSLLYAWQEGGFVKPLINGTDHKGFSVLAYECRECDREFFINESMFLDFEKEQGESMFKYYKYFIEICGDYGIADANFLQDMAFEFGYKWESNGQKHLKKSFNYLSIEPESKHLFYLHEKPPFSEQIIDLHGYIQLLNGIEPQQKPKEINHFSEAYQHGRYPREEWRLEVTERNTQLGYWEWVDHRIEADDE